MFTLFAIFWKAVVAQLERQSGEAEAETPVFETLLTQALSQAAQHSDIVCDVCSIMFGDNWDPAQNLAFDYILSVFIREPGGRPEKRG